LGHLLPLLVVGTIVSVCVGVVGMIFALAMLLLFCARGRYLFMKLKRELNEVKEESRAEMLKAYYEEEEVLLQQAADYGNQILDQYIGFLLILCFSLSFFSVFFRSLLVLFCLFWFSLVVSYVCGGNGSV